MIYHTTLFFHENKDWLGNAAWHLFHRGEIDTPCLLSDNRM